MSNLFKGSDLSLRFRVIFVQFLPCFGLVLLTVHLYFGMKSAEQRRGRLMSFGSTISASSISSDRLTYRIAPPPRSR